MDRAPVGSLVSQGLVLVALLHAIGAEAAPRPVFDSIGIGGTRWVAGYEERRATALRLADAHGPAELTLLPSNTSYTSYYFPQKRVEHWQLNGAGVPRLAGFTPLQAEPLAAIWVDVNGDGCADLVCAELGAVEVLLSSASGLVTPGRLIPMYSGASLRDRVNITAGDFNGDGKVDVSINHADGGSLTGGEMVLSVGDPSGSQVVQGWYADIAVPFLFDSDQVPDVLSVNISSLFAFWGLGRGDGSFDWVPDPVAGDGAPQVADLDQDGFADLIVGRYVYRGDASGVPSLIDSLEQVTSGLVDMDHDGRVDQIAIVRGEVQLRRGLGDGGFGIPRSFLAGAFAVPWVGFTRWFEFGDVHIGDLDGDGWTDIATSGAAGASWTILRGVAGGGFPSPLQYASGSEPVQCAVEDVTGDGEPDLITLARGARRLEVRAGRGRGAFDMPVAHPLAAGARRFAFADIDADGHRDIIVACDSAQSICILPGSGTGMGARIDHFIGEPVFDLAIADIDEDGTPDLMTIEGARRVMLHRGLTMTALGPAEWLLHLSYKVVDQFRMRDVDSDGHLDLAVATGDNMGSYLEAWRGDGRGDFGYFPNGAYWEVYASARSVPFTVDPLIDDGLPSFVYAANTFWYKTSSLVRATRIAPDGRHIELPNPPEVVVSLPGQEVGFPSGADVSQIEVADVTNDGIKDVVVLSRGDAWLGVMVGKGGDLFEPMVTHAVAERPESFTLADVDGDGALDALVACAGAGVVQVLRNTTTLVAGVGDPPRRTPLSVRPAGSRGRLALTLASSEPASLEVFDIQGRQVASQSLASPSAGDREVTVAGMPRMSGVYLARLRQGGQSVSTRWLQMR